MASNCEIDLTVHGNLKRSFGQNLSSLDPGSRLKRIECWAFFYFSWERVPVVNYSLAEHILSYSQSGKGLHHLHANTCS